MRRLGLVMTVVGAVAFAALLALGLAIGSDTASAQDFCNPVFPSTYNGTVTIDGSPAADGVVINAVVGGEVFGSASTSGGSYVMNVPEPMPSEPPCFDTALITAGGIISFTCDGVVADETGTWGSGLNELDLTCAAAAPPPTEVPTLVPTLVPTEVPTEVPTAAPPTGMGGGTSGDGGFIWWPLALAAAAMTSVAGLFTARWARR